MPSWGASLRRAILPAALLALVAFAGCVVPDAGTNVDVLDVPLYAYRYTGDDVVVEGYPYGFMLRVSNPASRALDVQIRADGFNGTILWPSSDDATTPATAPVRADADVAMDSLPANASRPYIFQAETVAGTEITVQVSLIDGGEVVHEAEHRRNVTKLSGHAGVRPGDHVDTYTVGVWTNGTSFYTNIAELNTDPMFPAGYDPAGFGGDPLPIYVYETTRTEQPVGSRDNCRFTTIEGYNRLLKTQADGGTNARFLAPEMAYTVEGAENHFLYGEALIFLNTIVAHRGGTTNEDEVADPTGACYDPRNPCRKIDDVDVQRECFRPLPADPPVEIRVDPREHLAIGTTSTRPIS